MFVVREASQCVVVHVSVFIGEGYHSVVVVVVQVSVFKGERYHSVVVVVQV